MNLVKTYKDDLEEDFTDEFIQFSSMVKENENELKVNYMMQLLADGGPLLGSFPNVKIALRIFLSISATNCEGERSFSTLSRIKNYLRTAIGQNRLSALSLMSIESGLLRDISFEDLINEFAVKKSRRKF